jgi:(2Fe-2S) ferredoxin
MKFKKHVFICEKCTFQKPDGSMSDPTEAKVFRKIVKDQALLNWPKTAVRINASGCLGQCERGISCVIYPEGQWLLELRPGQEDKVIKELKSFEK